MLEKLGMTLGVIMLSLFLLIGIGLVAFFGSVLLPVLAVVGLVLFVPIAIGILIGSIGKK